MLLRGWIVTVLALYSAPVIAQNRPPRVWIDVDFARLQPSQDLQTFSGSRTLFSETQTFTAAYPPLPSLNGIIVGGGVGIVKGLGVSVRLNFLNYTNLIGLAVTVPSPYFFNTVASDATVTASPLERRERGIDISATYSAAVSDRVTVRVFGGPTLFHVDDDMVSGIAYNQTASSLVRINVVNITAFNHNEVSGSTLGFNVGGDVSVFLVRNVGVGGGVRFNRGTVSLIDPLTARSADLNVGSAEFSGGLRLRF